MKPWINHEKRANRKEDTSAFNILLLKIIFKIKLKK